MKIIVKDNMNPNDFTEIEVLSFNIPNKFICLVDQIDQTSELYIYNNGECVFTMFESSLMSQQELEDLCNTLLMLSESTGGFKNLQNQLKWFADQLEKSI